MQDNPEERLQKAQHGAKIYAGLSLFKAQAALKHINDNNLTFEQGMVYVSKQHAKEPPKEKKKPAAKALQIEKSNPLTNFPHWYNDVLKPS